MATKLQTRRSVSQEQAREQLLNAFNKSSIPIEEKLVNLPLFMRSSALAKLLYINELYLLAKDVPGIVMEFGVWWGANMALFQNLRAVYEPYNYTRKVVGFDTFSGYTKPTPQDGTDELVFEGNYAVSSDYVEQLDRILDTHENENTLANIKKYELRKGDASETLPLYLQEHPETIIALAYFDMQLYEPTKTCLSLIVPHLTKGSVIAMDELNNPEFPGETKAFDEVFGLRNVSLKKSMYLPDRCYLIFE